MNERRAKQIEIFDEMIDILENTGALPYVVIIGSWAEHIYECAGVLQYKANLATQDVDLLIPNIRRPADEINISLALQENGFLIDQATMGGVGLSKYHKEGLLEIEFLVQEIGAGKVEPYNTKLGVTAQGLRNMDVLIETKTSVVYKQHSVTIPKPEAYVLHKLIINAERRPEYKQQKDAEAVRRLVMKAKSEVFNEQIRMVYDGLTKKQKKKVLDTCDRHELQEVRKLILI